MPLPESDIALIARWHVDSGATQSVRPRPSCMTNFSSRVRHAGPLRRACRTRRGLPAIPVLLGHDPLQPVSLLARRRRSHHRLGPRRERRHHQPRWRRRVPARRLVAAFLAGAGRGLAAGRHRPPTVATESPQQRVLPDAGRPLRALAFSDAFSLYLAGGVRARSAVRMSSIGGGLLHPRSLDLREHYLMWRPSATGPTPASGASIAPYGLRFVEHIFYVRDTRFQPLRRDLQCLGRVRRRGFGAPRHRVHAASVELSRVPSIRGRARVGRRRVLRDIASRGWRRWPGRLRLGFQRVTRYQGGLVGKLWIEPAQDADPGRGRRARIEVTGVSVGETSSSAYIGPTFFPVRGVMARWRSNAIRKRST